MKRENYLEELLQVMEQKKHWAWPMFTNGKVSKEVLNIHFEQEFEVYVRDFPVMVGWAYVQCPNATVRQDLAENLYEEETGGTAAGRPHPELFMDYPKGLGMDLARFQNITLLPKAKMYRDILDDLTQKCGWEVATAVTTIFIEGTRYERGEVDSKAEKRPAPDLSQHPLVLHYGLPVESLSLTKAHREVEGSHRRAAWDIVLDFIGESKRQDVISGMNRALQGWLDYRDDVASAVGLKKPSE